MAKSVLTTQAIKFLVGAYDDETTNLTFADIKQMIEDEYGIIVSTQAIHKSYHKHKDELAKTKTKPAVKTSFLPEQDSINDDTDTSNKSERIIKTDLTISNDFDTTVSDNLSSDDIANLLKPNNER